VRLPLIVAIETGVVMLASSPSTGCRANPGGPLVSSLEIVVALALRFTGDAARAWTWRSRARAAVSQRRRIVPGQSAAGGGDAEPRGLKPGSTSPLKPGSTSPLKPRLHAQAQRGFRRGRTLEADTLMAWLSTRAAVERRAKKGRYTMA
jgi:hypothetical protein